MHKVSSIQNWFSVVSNLMSRALFAPSLIITKIFWSSVISVPITITVKLFNVGWDISRRNHNSSNFSVTIIRILHTIVFNPNLISISVTFLYILSQITFTEFRSTREWNNNWVKLGSHSILSIGLSSRLCIPSILILWWNRVGIISSESIFSHSVSILQLRSRSVD